MPKPIKKEVKFKVSIGLLASTRKSGFDKMSLSYHVPISKFHEIISYLEQFKNEKKEE